MRRLLLRITTGVIVALSLLGAVLASKSSARPHRIVIQRAAVIAAGDRRLGTLAGADTVRGAIVLRPRNDAALTRFIASVTDSHSPAFGHYLRAGAFASRFGPAAGARTAVTAALRAQGLHVGAPSADGLIVPFSGTAADADVLFSTSIHSVALSDGALGRAASTPVSLPSSIAASVAAVVGLNDTVATRRIASPSTSPSGARDASRVSGTRAATMNATLRAAPRPVPVRRRAPTRPRTTGSPMTPSRGPTEPAACTAPATPASGSTSPSTSSSRSCAPTCARSTAATSGPRARRR